MKRTAQRNKGSRKGQPREPGNQTGKTATHGQRKLSENLVEGR
jgi:hypothetical protein